MDGPPGVGQARVPKRPFPDEEQRKDVRSPCFLKWFPDSVFKNLKCLYKALMFRCSFYVDPSVCLCMVNCSNAQQKLENSPVPAGSLPLLLQGPRATTEPSLHQPQATSHARHQLVHAGSLASHPSPSPVSLLPPPCKVMSLPSSSLSYHDILGF